MIRVTYKRTLYFDPEELLNVDPDLDLSDPKAVRDAVQFHLEDYDFGESADQHIHVGTGVSEEDLQDALQEHGIGAAMGTQLIKKDDLITDPIIWTVEDLRSFNDPDDPDEGDVDLDHWFNSRCWKTLNERSIEVGWQVIENLLTRTEAKEDE